MRPGHLFLLSFHLLPLAGAPLLSHPAYRCFSGLSRVVLAGAAGAVLASTIMTVFALVGIRWTVPSVLGVAFLLAFLLRRALLSEAEIPGDGPPPSPPAAAVRLAAAFAFLAVASALLATSAGAATSTDLVFLWGPKAAQFARAMTVDAAFLADPQLSYMHPYYPPLVTNVFAFGAMLAGRFPWGAVTLTFPLLLAALALSLPGILRSGLPLPAAHATSALVIGVLSLIGIRAHMAGNADMPLLLFETLAMALLLSPFASREAGKLLAGLLLAGAASAKIEGLPFVLVAVFLFTLIARPAARPLGKTLALLLSPTVLLFGLWLAFSAARGLGYRGSGRLLEIYWGETGRVLAGIARALWSVDFGLPYLVPLLVLILAPGRSQRWTIPVGVAVALLPFFVFIYLHVPDPTNFVGWSAARCFSPAAMLFALAAAARAAPPEEE